MGLADALALHWRSNERLRFLAVGGWNTLFAYLAFFTLYGLLHDRLHYLVIGLLAHGLAVVNAFTCHRLLVFRSRGSLLTEFIRFNLAQVFVLGCGLVGLWFVVSVLRISPLLGQALVMACSVVLSYLAHRRYSFAP